MKYKIYGIVTVSCYCEVYAPTADDARAIASSLQPVLDFNGSRAHADESWLVSEADGTPEITRVEEDEP